MRQFLGIIRRAVIGFIEDRFEQVPEIALGIPFKVLTRSVEGREIPVYTIGKGKKQVIMVAGIHGNEVGTVKLAHYLVNQVGRNQELYKNVTFHIVPLLNQDGYFLARHNRDYLHGGRVGRFNARNVDLNRNFDTPSFTSKTTWGFGKDYSETQEVFAGAKAGSEPEVVALMDYIRDEKITTYIAFHSAGRDVMPNNRPEAKELARVFSGMTGYRYVEPESEYNRRHTGTAKEWCEVQKIDYLEIEASSRWGSDWKNQRAGIEGCLEVINKG